MLPVCSMAMRLCGCRGKHRLVIRSSSFFEEATMAGSVRSIGWEGRKVKSMAYRQEKKQWCSGHSRSLWVGVRPDEEEDPE